MQQKMAPGFYQFTAPGNRRREPTTMFHSGLDAAYGRFHSRIWSCMASTEGNRVSS